jgi:NTP pyrophosphatase (non-canonical NTP hydrolase)
MSQKRQRADNLGGFGKPGYAKPGNPVGDTDTNIADLKALVRQFAEERAWQPFHSPKNLAVGIAVEAAELMECFLWVDLPASYEAANDPKQREAISDEMADVFCYLLNMSNVIGIDLSDALRAKMVKNAGKYPVEKYKGKYQL